MLIARNPKLVESPVTMGSAFSCKFVLGACQPSAPVNYVVVNFLFQLIFSFPLFWGMVMYANEFKTKEKQKLTEIKN